MRDKTVYFVDTSALFKRYIKEKGTEEIDLLFDEDICIYISDLSIIEFISNLKRLIDLDNIIDSDLYNSIKKELFNDIKTGRIEVVNTSSHEIITAAELIDKKHISPIDSLQLAFSVNMKDEYSNLIFVSSDKKLCKLAAANEINVHEIN